MFGSMRVVGLASLVICAAAVGISHGQPAEIPAAAPVNPGVQPAPPVSAGEPVLRQELDGRRSVRGCNVGETCTTPSDTLKEIDVELFPKPGASPWLDERAPAPSRLEAGP